MERHGSAELRGLLSKWPAARPRNWLETVNAALTAKELARLRQSAARGRPYGEMTWVEQTVKKLGLELTMCGKGVRGRKAREVSMETSCVPVSLFQTTIAAMRSAAGETRPLAECPGHLVRYSSFELSEALSVLLVLARWDAVVVPSEAEYSITFSHDGFIELRYKNATLAEEMSSRLSRLNGLQSLQQCNIVGGST